MENPIKIDDLGGTTSFGNIHIYIGSATCSFLEFWPKVLQVKPVRSLAPLVKAKSVFFCIVFIKGTSEHLSFHHVDIWHHSYKDAIISKKTARSNVLVVSNGFVPVHVGFAEFLDNMCHRFTPHPIWWWWMAVSSLLHGWPLWGTSDYCTECHETLNMAPMAVTLGAMGVQEV